MYINDNIKIKYEDQLIPLIFNSLGLNIHNLHELENEPIQYRI